ncbi:MAG: pyridoxine kinase, partial [Phenylobacterium sp.]|nr:pyridoxine kinase [Phenylobacterium sp.]
MPLALIISSHVAASRVGGSAQALAFAPFKVDAMVVPTVLYGRHPGWGPPGGAAVPVDAIDGMLDGIEANGYFSQIDLVITGYFASSAQVRAAARAIDAVRAAPREQSA